MKDPYLDEKGQRELLKHLRATIEWDLNNPASFYRELEALVCAADFRFKSGILAIRAQKVYTRVASIWTSKRPGFWASCY